MNKTLIYIFYCRNNFFEYDEVFKLHLELLYKNINIFNYYKFILSFDDLNNNDIIEFYINYISTYLQLKDKNGFVIVQNSPNNREGIHFFEQIILNLNEYDGLIFFGHNKTDLGYNKENIYNWIIGAHFINFYDINDIENKLTNDKYIAYGAFPQYWQSNECEQVMAKGTYMYTGSFYWFYPKKILENNKDELLLYIDYLINFLSDDFVKDNNIDTNNEFKYFAEVWLDNICNFYQSCTTLNNIKPKPTFTYYRNDKSTRIILEQYTMGYYMNIVPRYLTPEQNIKYNKYFNDICNFLNISFE